jgi:hypothetical protein
MSDAQIVLAFVLDGQTSTLDDKKAALALAKECPRRGGRDRFRHGQVPRPRRQVGLSHLPGSCVASSVLIHATSCRDRTTGQYVVSAGHAERKLSSPSHQPRYSDIPPRWPTAITRPDEADASNRSANAV